MTNYNNPTYVYVVGNSALPNNTAVANFYNHIALGLIIDIQSSQIVEANISLVNPLGSKFIEDQMIGYNIDHDLNKIIKNIERYQGPAQKAIIVALKNANDRFKNYNADL